MLAPATPWGTPGDPDLIDQDIAEPAEHLRWLVTDTGSAEWAMQRLVEARDAQDALERQRREWVAQIDAWYAEQVGPHQRTAAHFAALLERYALEQRRAGGKATVKLPSGTVKTTASRPKVEVTDKARFIEWVAANLSEYEAEQVIAWDPRPRVGVIAERWLREVERSNEVETTTEWMVLADADAGELVPGVEAVPPTVTASVVTG